MENKNDLSKKLILGLIIGGIVGAGLLYLNRSAHKKTPVLKKIGKTVSQVGEMLENCDLDSTMHAIEDKAPEVTDMISTVTDWVNTAMSLWKTIKKG